MKIYSPLLAVIALLFLHCSPEEKQPMLLQKTDVQPPAPAKKTKELTIHGDTRIDNYYWLNERENPEVIAYLAAENTYRDTMMSHLKTLEDSLYKEIIGRIKQDDASVPYPDNGYFYYSRFEEGKEYPIFCRKKGSLEASEEIMLNVNEMAADYSFYSASGLAVSPDNSILAFAEDTLSRRIYTIRFKDLKTGAFFEDRIPNTDGNPTWANDNRTVFYTVKDETLRSYKVFRHTLGTPASQDAEVFHEKDETFGCYIGKTKSRQYLIIASYQTLSTEFRYLKADDPNGTFQVFQPRERDLEYRIEHAGDSWLVLTNLEARDFRLMKTPLDKTTKENWTEVVAHRPNILLEDMDVFRDFLVLYERQEGIVRTRILPNEGEGHYVDFGEEAYMAYGVNNTEFDTDKVRLFFTSLTTPNSTLEYDVTNRKLTVLKQEEVLGGFDKNNYESERIYATARDGVKVPISLVYRKGFKKDGSAPLLLYGYGSYGYSIDPTFQSSRLSLLDRGFVFAIAHIRGGQEMGRQWYEDGKLLKKMNTFTDFIDCGEFLVKEKYAAKDKLFATGGSAGGLLMGAVVNLRPDLWSGIVSAVPFVDVVTTMLDPSIPLTTGEYDEWGNPNEKAAYDYMLSYSPYDNVKAQAYPNLLVTTGFHDSQVQYWEPAKWVARLRERKTDQNLLLLKTDMEAGHGGKTGRFKPFYDAAFEYAFMLMLAGKTE